MGGLIHGSGPRIVRHVGSQPRMTSPAGQALNSLTRYPSPLLLREQTEGPLGGLMHGRKPHTGRLSHAGRDSVRWLIVTSHPSVAVGR